MHFWSILNTVTIYIYNKLKVYIFRLILISLGIYHIKGGFFMELLINICVIVSDFIIDIFSGDEWKKIGKWIKKAN